MHIEERITIAAPPEAIFAVYAQVDQWHTWDPDTKTASLDGPFAVGTRGRIVPTQGRGVPMMVTALAPNKSFTVEGRIPGFRMVFEHELQPAGSATQALHRVSFHGPCGFCSARWWVGKCAMVCLKPCGRSSAYWRQGSAWPNAPEPRCGRIERRVPAFWFCHLFLSQTGH